MKKLITTAAIIAALTLPTHALATGMPTFDLNAYLNGLSEIEILKNLKEFQANAQKLQEEIMNKIQDMAGYDKTVQASQDAIIKTIDANTPHTVDDINKKIEETNHNISIYKTPDEQAADILKQKNEIFLFEQQCAKNKKDLLAQISQNAKAKSDFMRGSHTNTWYQENAGRIESYKATDEANKAMLHEVTTNCDERLKLMNKDLQISANGAAGMTFDQEQQRDTTETNDFLKKRLTEIGAKSNDK